MEVCGEYLEPMNNIFNLDYLFTKCSWCVKNNFSNHIRVCKYIDQILHLSTNSFTLDHLSYANDIIEYLAENFLIEANCMYYLKRMSTLCLMPPTVNSVTECSENLPTLIRFYDVMAKCIQLVNTHDDELNMVLLGVIQSSVFRCQPVPENSVSLGCCHEAIEMSGLPKTLMELVNNAPNQTFLVDLLKLSFNLSVVSDRSVLQMMESDGINILVAVLKPNYLSISLSSYERLTVCEFVILLLNRMFSLKRMTSLTTLELPRITRDTFEIILCNIKIEMEKNVLRSMKKRNDICYLLAEIVDNCFFDEQVLSDEIITDMVMLCSWPEIVNNLHWLENVGFNSVNENLLFKNFMLDVINNVFINLSQKSEFQLLNTVLIKAFTLLLNVKYSKKTYGDDMHMVLNRLLLNLPYLLLNSTDCSVRNDCCTELIALVKSLRSQECFSRTMIDVMICIGIASNDNYDLLRKFKALKTDILINAVISDTLKREDYNCFQDISLYGLNVLNIFFRENQHNPEGQLMIFNVVMRMVKLYLVEYIDNKINQNLVMDLLHFIKNAIIRYNDQVEHFIGAGGVEILLDVLPCAKYPIQLVILTTLVDLAVYKSAKSRVKKWKCAKTNKGYLELVCEIWRLEQVRFDFIDDELVFREQRDRTTVENVTDGCSPTVDSMYMCAQPKIYLLLQLVEFPDDEGGLDGHDVKQKTVRACGRVPGSRDKATVAHIYHYYSLKLGEIWNENDLLSRGPGDPVSSVESQSIDIMTVQHACLMAMIKTIKREVTDDHVGDSEIKLENKLYEEIRRYHSIN